MRRQATSALEIEQVQRVCGLLGGGMSAGQMVVVTTADGQRRAGMLLSHKSGSRLAKRGKTPAHYGSIELAMATGTVEINYLDIVLIAPQ